MNKAATRIRIRQICCLGLTEELLATALVPAVRDLVASESGAFAWADRFGKVTNVYADCIASMRLVTSVPEIRMANRAAGNAIENHEAVTEWGASRVLNGIVRNAGSELAQLTLCRPASATGFSAGDVADLSSVMHYIAHGLALGRNLSRGNMDSIDFGDSPEEALVIADRRGVLKHATEEGRRMLLLAAGCKINSSSLAGSAFVASDLLKTVCAPRGTDARSRAEPHSTICRTSWGKFVLRAYPLDDAASGEGDLVGVRIQRQEPVLIKVVRAISKLPLSPQQRQIALLIAQGMSNRQIAASLSVSCNTVAYHVRQLFMKLGVHDRGSLLARIDCGEEAFP